MLNSINTDKQSFRKLIRNLHLQTSCEDKKIKSTQIFEEFERKYLNKAKVVLAYWSIKDEVFTHDFILKWYKLKTILLPKMNNGLLDLKVFTGINCLKKSIQFDIFEPEGENFSNYSLIDIVIVPGIAFDKDRNRLGRGKGFYDKLLVDLKSHKVGVCFDYQFFNKIPAENHDIKMDSIIFA